jgi:4-hydroxy-2-oxoheptanedioate aldolase
MKTWLLLPLLLLSLSLCAPGQTPQGVRLNRVIELFQKGVPPLGVFVSNVSVRGAASLSPELDFIIIDMEHSPIDMTRLESYLLAMTNKQRIVKKGNLQMDVVPIVRLPANGRERSEFLVKQVLDLGVFGVIIPHVNNAEDALAAVQAMRYPQLQGTPDFRPLGHRGVAYGWAARYWGLTGAQYAAKADVWPLDPDGELLLWPMVESAEAVENIRPILKTPGVSGVFVGPSDLAFSLGVPLGDPRVEQAIAKVTAACKETGVACGTLTSENEVAARLKQGFRFLAVGGEGGLSGSVQRALQIGRGKNQ